MATTYTDMFEYAQMSIIMNTCTIEYTDVTLLKDMCKKKAGAKIAKIVLDPKTGIFTIPRAKKTPVHVPVSEPVEFKGVHTRFESESEPEPEKKKRVSKMKTKKDEEVFMTVFKVYSGRKIHKVVDKNDQAFEDVVETVSGILNIYGYDFKNHFSVNDDGCIVLCGRWDEIDTKTRHKTEYGNFAFKRIV